MSLSLCQPWDCTSFLKLSSKCATSPVSCCWDSGMVGSGEGGVQRGEEGCRDCREEGRELEGTVGDNQGGCRN